VKQSYYRRSPFASAMFAGGMLQHITRKHCQHITRNQLQCLRVECYNIPPANIANISSAMLTECLLALFALYRLRGGLQPGPTGIERSARWRPKTSPSPDWHRSPSLPPPARSQHDGIPQSIEAVTGGYPSSCCNQ